MFHRIRSLFTFTLKGRRYSLFGVVFFVSCALLVSRLLEVVALQYYDRNWEDVVTGKSVTYLNAAEGAFTGVQRVTRRIATEIAQSQPVLSYLSSQGEDRTALFDYVSRTSRSQDVGVEVYSRAGTLVAWEGRSGPVHQREVRIALAGQLTSYVTRSTIYSQLFVAIPVRANGSILGAVLVRRTIEVNYPVDNTYIGHEGLADQLTQSLGVPVELNFSEKAGIRTDGSFVSAVLYGIDSSKVGVVSVARPVRSAYLEGLNSTFQHANACLAALLIALLSGIAALHGERMKSVAARCVAVTLLVWLMRYALLWLDIPSALVSSGIFDPASFASKFGGGLAKSIGEMTLSVLALTINLLVIGRILIARHASTGTRQRIWVGLRGTLALVVMVILFGLLRAYGAAIRSSVFDSVLQFNDPREIIPSFELAVMVFSIFMLSFCMIAVAFASIRFCVGLLSNSQRDPTLPRWKDPSWVTAGVLLVVVAVLFDFVDGDFLMSLPYRIAFGVGMLAFTYSVHRPQSSALPLPTPRNVLVTIGLAALLLSPLLDENVHQRDRQRIETFAQEVLRPVDSWFKFVVDEALRSFVTDTTVDVLAGKDEDAIERLAFTHWARSSACREGYTSIFGLIDSGDHEVSRFTIGGQAAAASEVYSTMTLARTKIIRVKDIGTGINAVKVYGGSIPIVRADGAPVGHGLVVIAAGQQTLFRGENPPILRGAVQGGLQSFYRPVTISEFRDGVLVTSNSESLPIGYILPEYVRQEFSDPATTSVWAEEVIDGRSFESFFVRRDPGSSVVLALSVKELRLVWHVISVVKVLAYCVILLITFYASVLILRWFRGERYSIAFRDRLLIALIVTALVPLASVTLYGRYYARERLMDDTAKRLKEETSSVVLNVAEPQHGRQNDADFPITQPAAEQIAADLGTDFNLYVENELKVSSQPELYEAGILDRRMSGSAYEHIVLRGKRFHLQTESIGAYQYAVGYRPVLDNAGAIIGVVSVPTVYRQDELEEENSRRNAFLFGIYALVLLSILVIATTFANRIAAPIHRLTEATKRVSQGDLDVNLRTSGADGEIGELVRSFGAMTRDLKRNREHLIRYERELAWKEMARQVAHEIKNPLTPMKLSLQHLRQTYKDKVPHFGQVLDDVSKTIIEQIETLSHIASEFSHFGRMPRAHLETCEVNAILTESVHLFDQGTKVEFTLSLDANLRPLMADHDELRRAFINVIRNGIQAMENRGRMVITSRENAGRIVITIRDSGPGIPAEIKEKLFEPNFSTKTDGMGLGLAIVKKTVDDLKGSIAVESDSGEGTTVTITLPFSMTPVESTTGKS